MLFLAATLVGWIGGDFVYRKVAAIAYSSGYMMADRRKRRQTDMLITILHQSGVTNERLLGGCYKQIIVKKLNSLKRLVRTTVAESHN